MILWNTFFRMSRVCRHWRQVASEPRLWRIVNLSTFYLKIFTSATILQQLAPERLKHVRNLCLDGWSKLTDKGIEVSFRGSTVFFIKFMIILLTSLLLKATFY